MLRLPRFQFFFNILSLVKHLLLLIVTNLKTGKTTDRFVEVCKSKFQRKYCLPVSSFRVGFFYSLKALDFKKGDELILSAMTIPETVNALIMLGIKPVFVDLDLNSHAMDFEDLVTKITPKTKAVLITYLSGIPNEIKKFEDFLKEKNIILIEDFSQNFASTSQGRPYGSFGDISIGSLSCGKLISSTVGGIVMLNDSILADRITDLRKKEIAANRLVLAYYLYYAFKVTIATLRPVYKYFTSNYLLWVSKKSSNGLADFEHDPKHRLNLFYTYRPVLRNEFPKEFFFSFTDYQASIALDMIKSVDQGLLKRRELVDFLFSKLSEECRKLFPKNTFQINDNAFYHLPMYCGQETEKVRLEMFKAGVDSGCYGLNFCTEEEIFKDYQCELPKTTIIKKHALFIPINEKYTKGEMALVADVLNKITKQFELKLS